MSDSPKSTRGAFSLRLLPRWFGDLPEETVRRVLEYKHKKQPLSPVDEYCVTPIGKAIALRLPRCISPNVVSLFGGFCALVSCGLVIIGVSTGSALAHILAGLMWCAYQLADVTDGAHARGTGQGTPVGSIVDHCVDAVVCIFGAIAACTACDPSGIHRLLGIRTAVMLLVAFFGAQWAEYVGAPFDDRGVVEANLITAVCLALPGLVRLDLFLTPVELWFVGPSTLGGAVILGVFLFACFQGISRIVEVVWHTKRPGLVLQFAPIFMHWLAAEILVYYMPEATFATWLVVTLTLFSAMSTTSMKMRLAATVTADWQILHAEVFPPLLLAAFVAYGIHVAPLVFVLTFVWEALVMLMLWYDMVTRVCGILDLPFLAEIPLKQS